MNNNNTIVDRLDSESLDDVLRALRAEPGEQRAGADRLAREFAADCAAHVLHLFDQVYPDDTRPRQAIEMARRYARGEATSEELVAAQAAAQAAAWSAARAAAETARAVAQAARAAADAAWSARAAAQAARAAADAAWSAAGAAAWSAERAWQTARLRELLTD